MLYVQPEVDTCLGQQHYCTPNNISTHSLHMLLVPGYTASPNPSGPQDIVAKIYTLLNGTSSVQDHLELEEKENTSEVFLVKLFPY